MILISLSYVIWLPSILGFGAPFLHALKRKIPAEPDPIDLLIVLILGLAVLGSAINLLNFVIPISPLVAGGILLLGWILFLFYRRSVWNAAQDSWSGSSAGFLLVAVGLIAAVGWATRKSNPFYDEGLYYLQTLRWFAESRVPLGLANLHGRLGYNSLWFSVASALAIPGLQGKSLLITNGLLFAAYLLAVGAGTVKAFARGLSVSCTFLILSMIPCFMLIKDTTMLGSGRPDMVIALLGLTSVYLCVRSLEVENSRMYYIVAAAVVSIFATAVKLSAFPLLFAPFIMLFWLLHREHKHAENTWQCMKTLVLSVMAIGIVVLLPWMLRGIALSGCVVYPFSLGCIHSVSWTTPDILVRSESLWIRSAARDTGFPLMSPDIVLASWNWFPSWFKEFRSDAAVRCSMALVVGGAILWLASGKRNLALREVEPWAVPFLVPLAGLGYWFWTAPTIRFGLAYLWPISLLMLAGGIVRFLTAYVAFELRSSRNLVLGLCACALAVCAPVVYQYRGWPNREMLFAWPAAAPAASLVRYEALNGMSIWSPETGDQCWDAQLPCTPYFHPGLDIALDETGGLRVIRDTDPSGSPFVIESLRQAASESR